MKAAGMNFPRALRAFCDGPGRDHAGEIRDLGTSQNRIQASLTGHLVLHHAGTQRRPGAVTRLVDMGIEPFSDFIHVVVRARPAVVRTTCKKCRPLRAGRKTSLGCSTYLRTTLATRFSTTDAGCAIATTPATKGAEGYLNCW